MSPASEWGEGAQRCGNRREESLGTQERKVELWVKKKVWVGMQGSACPLGPQQSPRPPRVEGQKRGDKLEM